ncbi:hypothetical protein Cs7R123_21210 [Catellatospora sp. TT07R-123]|uniref:hypothetical protein n=1 Tax=Catellatospora sp. TT07R-123 TaxID=2733863 RepID=UPI001B0D911C|nr:hypothetical protein [Catellatospora sp. TT07R-123]GHJ44779.1 hypothetical protein Cs7R123_21210 [Catellatospora sp. TT07R-123]
MPLQNDDSSPEDLFAALRHAVLDGPGSTPARVRQAVAAAKLDEVSQELRGYVGTMREHAWRSTDEQVRELLAAGWSEDQVYELTVAVAVGAGQRRVDAGLAALARARSRHAAGAPRTPHQARPADTGAVASAAA